MHQQSSGNQATNVSVSSVFSILVDAPMCSVARMVARNKQQENLRLEREILLENDHPSKPPRSIILAKMMGASIRHGEVTRFPSNFHDD